MKRVYVREEACIGCQLCAVFCQVQHSKSRDLIKAFKKEPYRPLPRVRIEKKGPVSFSVRCQHCDEPPCVYACLTGALSRDAVTGTITVDEEKCAGCWTCILACPFGAIKQDREHGRMLKCDLCTGIDIPACVSNCPNDALVYADSRDRD